MTSVGIMGGTFNPIHIGHLKIAQAAYEQYHLDEVWFMPNHVPGYKSKANLLDGAVRLDMINLSIHNYPHFKSSNFELLRTGNTYTAETMQLLSKDYPDIRFYFIIGEDSLNYFDKWWKPEVILSYAKILSAPRDTSSKQSMNKRIQELHEIFGENHFYPIDCPQIDCSSNEIRRQLETLDYDKLSPNQFMEISDRLCLVPEVLQYIVDKQLYK